LVLNKSFERGDTPWDQRTLVHIFSAIEVACLDIIGKIVNRPVVDLLGGRRRDTVPFSAYLFYKYEGAGGELGFKQTQCYGLECCQASKCNEPNWNSCTGKGYV
jgi:glucarate dehydratase